MAEQREPAPPGTSGRPGRGAGARRSTPSAASRGLAGPAATPRRPRLRVVPPQSGAGPEPDPAPNPADDQPTSQPEDQPTSHTADPAASPDDLLSFLRRRLTGDYPVDPFGFDADLTTSVLLPALRPLARRWFRLEVEGVGNVPDTGGALVVANHSGTVALDALITQLALHDEHPQHRHLRQLAADLVFDLPVVSDIARRSGATLACTEDAENLLAAGEVVGVWPEGFKGVGKPFSERYKLQRFGRGGFVAAAVRTGTPIVPCAIVGAEEIYPILADLEPLARLTGLPYVPVTPTFPWLGPLGLVPLPSKWMIVFGEPIHTDHLASEVADDPMAVFEITDQVRETIQQTLYATLARRGGAFRR